MVFRKDISLWHKNHAINLASVTVLMRNVLTLLVANEHGPARS
jgi:hypothetical protein